MAKQANRFMRVGDVLALFIAHGCEVRVAEPTVQLEDGDCLNVRYLLRTDTAAFVPLVDLEDDNQISVLEVAFWERRLGIRLPTPDKLN